MDALAHSRWILAAYVLAGLCACAGTHAPRASEAPSQHPDTVSAQPSQAGAHDVGSARAASDPSTWKDAKSVVSNAGRYLVRYRPATEPIAQGATFAVDVWVFDAQHPDAPLGDVTLTVDAAMPQHGHGMNRVPRLVARGAGHWRAEGLLFHMPGRWELYYDITRGAVTERAQVDVELE